MGFLTSEMVYRDYCWSVLDNNDLRITGAPDNSTFHSNEGYEMLHTINSFFFNGNSPNRDQGRKIERMLHDHLPVTIRLQYQVSQWVVDNWNNY